MNLSPKISQILHDWHIQFDDDFNPCHVFLLLKQEHRGTTSSVFWQLVGIKENCLPHQLSPQQRDFWQTALHQFPPVALFPPKNEMQHFMQIALHEAEKAFQNQEIPVGAVVVCNGEIIAQSHNQCIAQHCVAQHAEINALALAGKHQQNYRLNNCDLYVTLEPCAMCASAILQSRIRRVIYATAEPKTGAAGSVINLFSNKKLNFHTAVLGGILAEQSAQLLYDFFQQKRKKAA